MAYDLKNEDKNDFLVRFPELKFENVQLRVALIVDCSLQCRAARLLLL